ncbi:MULTISPECIES: hypothetical protein [Enterococcus]|uniref:Bacterial Pleckstrin homology domain-containing protein n=1 Tax=Candidatus Enterococcus mangumiae TaxID=2230878 RepID=A0ABZ2SSY7_9ENTE|nr:MULTISPECIES: hypothetical protein [unclassified Enterococcus]MBO0488729.1 hypothetical protein [Enterococcus sp. DIV1094]MBO1299130.1 hypothetical protein [Enterococcus sp. DIV1271a]
MAKVEIKNDQLIISMEGARKLWAMKSEIATPLTNVMGATADPDVWEDTPKFGEKRVGVDAYGHYFAGTFVQDSNKIFYDLKRKEDAVVITLKDEEFSRLIIGVEDPQATVAMIEQAMNR